MKNPLQSLSGINYNKIRIKIEIIIYPIINHHLTLKICSSYLVLLSSFILQLQIGTNNCTARYRTLSGEGVRDGSPSPSPTPSSDYDEIVHNNPQLQQQMNGNNLNFRADGLLGGGCNNKNGANNLKNLKVKRNNLSSTLSSAAHNKNSAISQQKVLVHHHVSDFSSNFSFSFHFSLVSSFCYINFLSGNLNGKCV